MQPTLSRQQQETIVPQFPECPRSRFRGKARDYRGGRTQIAVVAPIELAGQCTQELDCSTTALLPGR